MTYRHTVFVVCVAVALLVSPTMLAQETATTAQTTTNESDESAGMGAQVTAFAQSSSAAANDSVENGMWRAGFNQSNASDQAELVRNRAGSLERRLDRLRSQNASLRDQYENGSLPEPAYVARQSRLSARIDSLRTAINDTDEAAARAGVDDERLDRLRQNASNLTGPEVAGIARGLGGGPPEGTPAADRGGDRGPPNRTGGDRGSGPPADRTPPGRTNGPGQSEAGADNVTSASDGSDAANATDDGSTTGDTADRQSGAESDGQSGTTSDGQSNAGNGSSGDTSGGGGSSSAGGARGQGRN